jgi:hypothetical protein
MDKLEPRFIESCKKYANDRLDAMEKRDGILFDPEFRAIFVDVFIENMHKYMDDETRRLLFGTGKGKPIGILRGKAVLMEQR